MGCCAFESYPPHVLIRSVAVDPKHQGKKIGQELLERVLRHAKAIGAETAYLLTTTAEGYFPRFGFKPIQRSHVPMAVQQSKEFTSICPTSAMMMRKKPVESLPPISRRAMSIFLFSLANAPRKCRIKIQAKVHPKDAPFFVCMVRGFLFYPATATP